MALPGDERLGAEIVVGVGWASAGYWVDRCGLRRERMAALKAGTDAVQHEVTVTTVFSAVTGRMLADRAATKVVRW